MSNNKKSVDMQTLRTLVPVGELTQDSLQELVTKTCIEELPRGHALFRKGDSDNQSFYLLEGEVKLSDGEGKEQTLHGGSPQCRFPLDHHRPRQATALAMTAVRFIRIDNDLLDILLTWNQNAGYMVSEIDSAGETAEKDWMTRLLGSGIFHRIPPGNIQALFTRMKAVRYKKGSYVIRQGEEGDYYYYIRAGICLVTRRSSKTGKTLKLAQLTAGTGFGEEALIANAKRNADVRMQTDGVLMRLAKEDFNALLKAPVLQTVNFEEAHRLSKEGALWLDVRLQSEHGNYAIPKSLNIPLFMLRYLMSKLDRKKKYIVYCDTGRRSASAAFLLNERGFETYCLSGGLMGLRQRQKSG